MQIIGGSYSNIVLNEIPTTQTFSYSNTVQEYLVPLNVTKVKITAVGGSGADAGESFGGRGANISGVVNVSSLSTLYVITGSSGNGNTDQLSNAGQRGYFYDTVNGNFRFGGNGGGYSGVYSNSNLNITTALVIAGGGGGAGGVIGSGSIANGGNAAYDFPGNGANGNGGGRSNLTFNGRSDALLQNFANANMDLTFSGTINTSYPLNLHATSISTNANIKIQSLVSVVANGATGPSAATISSLSYTSNGGTARSGDTMGTSSGGGGGGASALGQNAVSATAGNGGAGVAVNLFSSNTEFYGGGGGGGSTGSGAIAGVGGIGGGGNGSLGGNASSGTVNTGGGGGGAGTMSSNVGSGGSGGSGIIIVRYPSGELEGTGGTTSNVTLTDVTYNVHTFTSNANFTVSNVNIDGVVIDYMVVGGGGGGGGQFNGGQTVFGCGGGGAGEVRLGNIVVWQGTTFASNIGSGGRQGGGSDSNTSNRNGGNGGFSSFSSTDGNISIVALGGGGGGYYNVVGLSSGGSAGGGGGRNSIRGGWTLANPEANIPAKFVIESGDTLDFGNSAFGNTYYNTNVTFTTTNSYIDYNFVDGDIRVTDNLSANKVFGAGGSYVSTSALRGFQANTGSIVNNSSNGVLTYAGWGSQIQGSDANGGGGGGGGSGWRSGGGGAGGNATQCGGGGGGASYVNTGDIIWNGQNDANASGSVTIDIVQSRTEFVYTGLPQRFIVPQNASALRITAVGAKGGNSNLSSAIGGNGANVTTVLLVGQHVNAGGILNVVVGGSPGNSSTATFGYGGNGGVQSNVSRSGTAGGGLSGVFTGSRPSIQNALIVAGGGGGAGKRSGFTNGGGSGIVYPGDASDGQAADGGKPQSGGKGGKTSTQTAGVAGTVYDTQVTNLGPTAGTTLQGGRGGAASSSSHFGGGGGGGGAYAGGGGAGGDTGCGGAGGGSSYAVTPLFFGDVNSANGSHGSVVIETIYGDEYTSTYRYTGRVQVYTPPAGATKILINAVGASGGNSYSINNVNAIQNFGGGGANIYAIANVTPGTAYYIVVGGCPGFSNVPSIMGNGGSGGSATDNNGIFNIGGAGGGLSGVFTSNTLSYANSLVIAGGGGGAATGPSSASGNVNYGGSAASSSNGNGNPGGELDRSTFGFNAGRGGSITTATAGAAGNQFNTVSTNPTAGSGLNGGNGAISTSSTLWGGVGGGGGGGAFGGGGGATGGDASGGGGAGASFFGNNSTNQQTFGTLNYGDGYVTITVVG